MRTYRSLDEARQVFEEYAHVEPRLRPLWDLCREASPLVGTQDVVAEEVFDDDPFEADDITADDPSDGWCAEDFFFEHVKSRLLLLVGAHRPGDPHPVLHSSQTYDTIYDILVNWALIRTCACCAESDDAPSGREAESRMYRQP